MWHIWCHTVRPTAPPSLFAAVRTFDCLTVSVNRLLQLCSCDVVILGRHFPILCEFYELPCTHFPSELYVGLVHELFPVFLSLLGTAVAQCLRCSATNRKVAGPIPAGFTDIKSFRSHYGSGVDPASNRNEYQEYFLAVKAAGA